MSKKLDNAEDFGSSHCYLAIAREGFRFAKENRDSWFSAVNQCPYGPAYPGGGNLRAEAWYRGWWFFHHVVKKWSDLAR